MTELAESQNLPKARMPRAQLPELTLPDQTTIDASALTMPAAEPKPESRPPARLAAAPVVSPALVSPGAGDWSPMFDKLVANDRDITGLVAYSLYKLSKREWIDAFLARHGRAPEAREIDAFITGETTERRIATYRRLADDALASRNPPPVSSRPAASSPIAAAAPQPVVSPPQPAKPDLRQMLIRFGLLALAVVVVGLLIRYLIVRA
jgi:hypothetical protein